MINDKNAVTLYAVETDVPMPHAVANRELQLVLVPDTASTAVVQRVIGKPFASGKSGNPAGRKPGSKNKLSELFIVAMRTDFAEHGASAIAALRHSDPGAYLAAIRSMIPHHTMAENADKLPTVDLAGMSDVEFADAIDSDGSPLEQAAQKTRRNRAFELFASGRFASMREAMIAVGAAIS